MAEQQTAPGDAAGPLLPPGSPVETSFQNPLAFVDAGQNISVLLGGDVIAESSNVIIVHEKGHTPVLYFPRDDVQMNRGQRTAQSTHCPRKGDASYYEFEAANQSDGGAAIAWSYEDPIPQALILKDYLAFYPHHLEFKREA